MRRLQARFAEVYLTKARPLCEAPNVVGPTFGGAGVLGMPGMPASPRATQVECADPNGRPRGPVPDFRNPG